MTLGGVKTARDFRTGEVVWEKLAGTGDMYDNFYAPIGFGPNGALYLNVYGGIQEEATIYEVVKRVVPQVQRVYVPISGAGRFHAYIQLKKTHDGQPKEAIMAALTSSYMIKHVVVVDDDIDIYDERRVLWAVATRSQWDKDLVVIRGCMGSPLDPSSGPRGIGTKAGIDATKPAPPKRFPMVLSIPGQVMERVKLEDYIPAEKLVGYSETRR